MRDDAVITQPPYFRIASYIALHARRRPEYTAVIRNGAAVSYATLHRNLQALTQALKALGIQPGEIAAVSHDDLYIQLLLVFGLEQLGATTGSFRADENAECHGLLAAASLVLAQTPKMQPFCRRLHLLSDQWVAAALAAPAPPTAITPPAGHDPLVIFRSSGTTGAPKLMLLTTRMLRERLARQLDPARGLGLHSKARFYAAMHFSVGSIYLGAANCLRLGATFAFDTRLTGPSGLAAHQATHMTILPFELRQMLSQMPATAASPALPKLRVQTIGARLPADLRRAALNKLCGQLLETYGTNEVGAIGVVDAQAGIALIRGVEAQVVGPRDKPLPPGETGALRLRARAMTHEYFNNPAASATMFRNGWFYPGDLAIFTGPGILRLVGRRSDVLNLGGHKIACADLESRILALPGVADIALIQPGGAIEPTRVIICVVSNTEFFLPSFTRNVERMISFPFAVQTISAIPRTATGKILRAQLEEKVSKKAA